MATAKPSPKNLSHQAAMTAKRSIIRKQLARAVLLSNKGEFTDFACEKQLTKEDIGLNTIKVDDGLDLQLPVSLQDIESLKQHFINKALNPMGMNTICTSPPNLDLSALVTQHLGLPSGLMNVQASPFQLILYDTKTEHKYCWPAISDSKLVTGKVILQLPVEGGHEGGDLKVDYNGRSKMFENAQSSDQSFYLTALYKFCNEQMQALTKGYKLTVVFNLVWTHDNAIANKDVPVFLNAVKKTKTAFAAWLNPDSYEGQITLQQTDGSDRKGSGSTEDIFENICLSNETLSDDVLFFVLQENYSENDLIFSRLRGEDKTLAHVLKSCDSLDVHLACVTLKSFNMEYGGMSRCATEDVSLKITRWLDSNDIIQNLNMELNWDKQRVGPIRNLLSSRGLQPHKETRTPITKEEEEDLEDTSYMPMILGFMPQFDRPRPVKRKQYFSRGVLVIWPKNQKSLMYCRYGMNSLLNEMELKLNSATLGQQEETRKEVMLKLRKIIMFCCAEPNKAWNYGDSYEYIIKKKKKNMDRGELTLRLLRICITLKAREEGLRFLKLLGSSFLSGSYYNKEMGFEGIQTEEVAQAMADFVHQVAGWDDSAELIKEMITPDRIKKQFISIIALAQRLRDVGCLEGSKSIGESLVSSVVNCLSENLHYELIKGVSSSFVWATVDSALKMKILSACTTYVEKQIVDVNARLEPVLDSTEERFRIIGLLHKMLDCSKFFILNEKNQCNPQQKNVAQDFYLLLDKLPTLVIMHLIISIHEKECETSPSFKDFPTLLDWYRVMCKIFFARDFNAAIEDDKNNNCEEIPSKIVICLLWLNDVQTWQSFSQGMCRFTYQNNAFVRFLSKEVEIQNAIVDSTLAFDAFVIVMDQWTKQLTSLKEPAFNWKQPNAMFPRYPELEAFFRSDKESMIYSDLSCLEEAECFAEELEMLGRANGFSVKVTPRGNRNSARCTISKNRGFFSKQLESFRARKLEMQKLSQLFNTVYQKRHASTQ